MAGPATAGGKGQHARNGTKMAFSSDHIVAGTEYQVNGTGFRPNTWVTVAARYGTTFWGAGVTDSQGSFTFTFNAEGTGTIAHDASQDL